MENLDFEEQQLLEQLNIVRQKKQLKQSQQQLKDKLNEKELLLQTLDDDIKSKKEIYFKLQNEIPLLENDRVDLHQEIKDIKKLLKEIQPIPIVNEIINEPIVNEIINEPILQPIVIQDPLQSFESSKQLTHNELDNLKFWYRSIETNMSDLQIGDYISIYGKYHKTTYGKITRKTDKTIFYVSCISNESNKLLHYDWKINGYNERSYDYYYFNINTGNNLSTSEGKISIKGTIRKAINNFILVDEFDWGA
jgi:hypothetical protein